MCKLGIVLVIAAVVFGGLLGFDGGAPVFAVGMLFIVFGKALP